MSLGTVFSFEERFITGYADSTQETIFFDYVTINTGDSDNDDYDNDDDDVSQDDYDDYDEDRTFARGGSMSKGDSSTKATTTVNELFEWYMGGDWKNDWQTTNTMRVDGIHAQNKMSQGEKALADLVKNANKTINVKGKKDKFDGTWELSFSLQGKEYEIQASAFYGQDGY
jgi:hypothetical protein